MNKKNPDFISTTNACKLCRPLGAVLAFRGVEGAVPYLHGSQGCATYMRRYIISHFNEPIDIASSSLGEKNAIYGGGPNLKLGLQNVTTKYRPKLIGIGTTCLTETIGDDLPSLLAEYHREFTAGDDAPPLLIRVSTPSYAGSHMEGFHGAVRALVEQLAVPPVNGQKSAGKEPSRAGVNLFPGLVSPADLRLLKDVLAEFNLPATVLPDFSDTLDGPALDDYPLIPAGGTEIAAIAQMGQAAASLEFGRTIPAALSAADWLEKHHGVPRLRLGLPLGIRETDRFMARLAELANPEATPPRTPATAEGNHQPPPLLPPRQAAARGRLLDAMVDGHKYLAGQKAVVYGEEDLVVGLVALLAELGVKPVLCASGGKSGQLAAAVREVTAELLPDSPEVHEDCDFFDIAEQTRQLQPDLLIGHSKGYSLARELEIPLIRVGFPIHDRMGGQRLLHLGYLGAQQLFDTLVNTVMARKQDLSPVGYSYM